MRHELWGEETFVDFEQGLNYCIRQIRTVLGDEAQNPRYVETIHGAATASLLRSALWRQARMPPRYQVNRSLSLGAVEEQRSKRLRALRTLAGI